ncbi:MAG: acyl-CoA thioesterase/bile acid-CoA:amino acid N-acyltransferase family protein [Candidatus Dormiibacterota bacterium]
MSARFEIPTSILVDQGLVIRVEGLEPSLPVTIRASLVDDEGMRWQSWAVFESGLDGQISTAATVAVDGTYRGAHPEGLLWSMVPDSTEAAMEHALKQGLKPTTVALTAEQDGIAPAHGEVELRWLAPGVVSEEVRSDGLFGTLFSPEGDGPFRPVLVFGGSDGGLRTDTAALLASHGFLSLALAYFRYRELPAELVSIPLEYFQRALQWLQNEPRSQPGGGVGVVGRSRGGELALILGATFDEVDAVVAYVPSGIVHAGIRGGEQSWQVNVPAWTLGGRPLPFLGHEAERRAPEELPPPIALTPIYCRDLADWASVSRAAIPVERSRGPVLLLSGVDDAMWPSSLLSELAVARLAGVDHSPIYKHLAFADAGHRFVLPTLPGTVTSGRHPADGQIYQYGGTPLGNSTAARLAHRAMIHWLRGETDQV